MDEALNRVLRLVSEGRLTAEEAAPILDALDEKAGTGPSEGARQAAAPAADPRGPRFARIQVLEGGRRSVDLRVPVGLGKFALSRIPGLSGEQINEMTDAMASGTHGPILDVQDADGDGVRIVLE
jgi:hypothetical protein